MRIGFKAIGLMSAAAILVGLTGLSAVILRSLPAHAQAQADHEDGTPQSLPAETLQVITHKGPVTFHVMVARTESQRQVGLMFRREMAADQGMIFDFPDVEPRAFWMHNTVLPLDIIFIDAKGQILNIAAKARPFDDTPLPSTGPARSVLEINGGLAAKLGIRPGDRVRDAEVYSR
jgi:uncharacterized membrane protein (UPF0127 family)